MIYPKIYSLSTVGMIKHYNHDYIFHHKRTDFIGSNGVGKSILADLLQLLFIYDKDLIKFGTDDVKETRFIHTLPYQTTFAYCFLNIIVEENKFITVGVQIHSQDRKRLVPFVITKSAELNKDLSQLAMNEDDVLFSRNFIKNKTIPDIQDLAEWLNDERKLKLVFFKNRDEVQGYYNFLSNKEILPINLSRENNLKAFAKIIQSFSKAKTLKLSGKDASKNLKEFLLEDAEGDIQLDFEKKKTELEKVLKEFNRLHEYTVQLENMQKCLKTLDLQDQTYSELLKEYKVAEISNCKLDLDLQKNIEAEGLKTFNEQNENLKKLEKLSEKIPYLEDEIQKRYKTAEKNHEQAHRYKQLKANIETLDTQIIEWTELVLPEIDGSWENLVEKVDISIRTVVEMKKEISFAQPYLKKYSTLEIIEQKREEQLIELDKIKVLLLSEKEHKEKLLKLLNDNQDGNVLHWYINTLPTLSLDAIQAVLYFATLSIAEIQSPINKDRYINTDALGNIQINKTDKGIWIRLGTLSEFIAHNPDATLLTNHSELNTGMQQLIIKQKNELAEIEKKLQALKGIRDGLDYDQTLFEHEFSPEICDVSKINQLKIAVSCILLRDENIETFKLAKRKEERALHILKEEFNILHDESDVELNLKNLKNHWFRRITRISKYSGQKEEELKALKNDIITTKKDLEIIARNIIKNQKDFDQLNNDFYRYFDENELQFNVETIQLPELKDKTEKAYDNYKITYIETASKFEETKGGKHIEVNYELQKHTYSFGVLERALLGKNLKTRDDIIPALKDANNERTRIADGIRDRMLEIFSKTTKGYNNYKNQVQSIGTFFLNRKRISNKYLFNVKFDPNLIVKIEDIQKMAYDIRNAAIDGQLTFFSNQSVTDFLEDFFKKLAGLKEKVPIAQLLDPKTYFHISASLEDEFGGDVSGSTGESYSAIALLAVARLSNQKEKTKGLRFMILEELGSLDDINFNIFPEIAEEFHYQIITMAPRSFNIGISDEWFAHHLIKGKINDKINHYPSSSYFKTKDFKEQLSTYLNKTAE